MAFPPTAPAGVPPRGGALALWVVIAAACLLAASPCAGQGAPVVHPTGVGVGALAPDLTLKTLTGDTARLGDLRGRPVLINFWASWCKPCAVEMPYIVAAYDSLRERGLVVLAVNLTDQERSKDVREFVDKFALPFPVLLDEKGRERKRFQLVSVPTSVFVDSVGLIRHVVAGPLSPEMLARGLTMILDGP